MPHHLHHAFPRAVPLPFNTPSQEQDRGSVRNLSRDIRVHVAANLRFAHSIRRTYKTIGLPSNWTSRAYAAAQREGRALEHRGAAAEGELVGSTHKQETPGLLFRKYKGHRNLRKVRDRNTSWFIFQTSSLYHLTPKKTVASIHCTCSVTPWK